VKSANCKELSSSVSVVTRGGLLKDGFEFLRGRRFSSHPKVQLGLRIHLTACSVSTGTVSCRQRLAVCDTNPLPLYSAEVTKASSYRYTATETPKLIVGCSASRLPFIQRWSSSLCSFLRPILKYSPLRLDALHITTYMRG
jgi:hypothetical protein